jgi:hypothetical protein
VAPSTNEEETIKGYQEDLLQAERRQKELRHQVQEARLTMDKIREHCQKNSVIDSRRVLQWLDEDQNPRRQKMKVLAGYAKDIWDKPDIDVWYEPETNMAGVNSGPYRLFYIEHPEALAVLARTLRFMHENRYL